MSWISLVLYVFALLPVGLPVLRETLEEWRHGDVFNEFTLMVLAAAGAFVLGEYPEGVAILLFYSFGEKLEDVAAERSRRRIRAMLSNLPKLALVEGRGAVEPESVRPGDILIVKPGERVALDGALLASDAMDFDTSAFTGESLPVSVLPDGEVAAGAIPVDREARVRVTKPYEDSSMSRVMAMIEDAASRKSKSETLLRRITRWYTPVVFAAAALLFLCPLVVGFLGGSAFQWRLWLERALVLLVCSCPCALVVGVPLSYFQAIGVASARGILFKSSSALDALRRCSTLFLDKTGTLTTGRFSVLELRPAQGFAPSRLLALAAAADSGSAHPLARAIVEAAGGDLPEVQDVRTVSHGVEARLDGQILLVGSRKLLETECVEAPEATAGGSEVCVALDGRFVGAIYLGDTLKDGVREILARLRRLGVKNIIILSGDRREAVEAVAEAVGADCARWELLPGSKEEIVRAATSARSETAFVGDGINDAPSLAAATVGVAVGTGGTDLAMETAGAVMTSPTLEPLVAGYELSRKVKRTVAAVVSFAIGVKLAVMVLGAMGLASLWAAVFADTGITLLTVFFTLLAIRPGKNR
ncbi:MAG: cadmium-translocating P-type ATPase [Muribaculaceae bacterium]|nr:cadmium-translocating P-type ATPase [Muribaculaceae bacterium]